MNLLDGRAPQHLGYLVHDVEATLAIFRDDLGCAVSGVDTLSIGPEELESGAPGNLRIAFVMLGTTMVELIEPEASTSNVWVDALSTRGPGLHHVAYTEIEHYDDQITAHQAAGFELTVAGHFGDDRWCYLEKGGLVFELASGIGPQFATA